MKRQPMTGAEFKALRKALCLTQEGIGKRLGPPDGGYHVRTVQGWENDSHKVPPAVELLVMMMATK